MTLADRLRVVQRGWAIFALFALLGGLGGLATALLSTPRFDATARVFLSVGETPTALDTLAATIYAQTRILSYATVATDPVVLRPVAADLGIDQNPDDLAARVTATPVADSLVVEIVASSRFNTEAAALANAVADQLVDVIELQLEAEMTDEGSSLTAQVLERAPVPTSSAYPQILPSLGAGLLVGSIIGVGMMLSRHSFDSRIRSVRDIADATEVRVLATIARTDNPETVVATVESSQASHDFRTLEAMMRFIGFEARSTLITGARPDQGATTVALGLAMASAQQGRRVLLVDANVRNPHVLEHLGLESDLGLTDLLVGAPLADAVQSWPVVPELSVIAAGSVAPNTHDLFASERARRLVQGLEERYDHVIIDAPPLSAGSDAVTLAPLAGSVLLAVTPGTLPREDLLRGIASLGHSELRGIVLTDVRRSRSRSTHDEYEPLDTELVGSGERTP
ncbi:succinoglycan biosynthesis transport protein ExoP [Microbacteriaceae bacterium SG_E_30_P1]|uniref:Succinoglycan biosynthesis transport protein ExoP n=1 Tax=Antiquaquibacter oligotrophicus TaxID=2880260 RepID=A0ABT6KQB0_9MICO|nr:polysaccharide biosynthesis tyrosine autokinase [Antiquaquibacter oligotrophicus]MDH6181688.1 succinoglycan biosynthesis transport protein ExoP [Antiquaquibacter oligotrophicus]UDF12628.1 hypothetical protein LH407_10750 [Antiquaquibacter oligotrophicus]